MAGHGRSSDVRDKEHGTRNSEFSDSERAALDDAKQRHEVAKHRAWLYATIAKVTKWIAATIAFVTLVADALQRLWKTFHG